ncbi:MAG: hypothetical protein KGI73_04545 [Patescibacteria group bacterium]|nr:hypothetical protein [Patescibacteria group bacterium]
MKPFEAVERSTHEWLSHHPIFYAVVGGVGTVLFWRGVWHTVDFLSARYIHSGAAPGTIDYPFLWDGFLSLVIGFVLLLVTGLFVAAFIGDHVIISGIRHEKQVAEKTEEEIEEEEAMEKRAHEELHDIAERLARIEKKLDIKTE